MYFYESIIFISSAAFANLNKPFKLNLTQGERNGWLVTVEKSFFVISH